MSLNRINKTTGEAIPVCSGTYYADLPIGAIIPFSGAIAPRDFLIADGRAVSRTTYKELFAVIGTTYGSGDGVNTFNVPDLRETVPVALVRMVRLLLQSMMCTRLVSLRTTN